MRCVPFTECLVAVVVSPNGGLVVCSADGAASVRSRDSWFRYSLLFLGPRPACSPPPEGVESSAALSGSRRRPRTRKSQYGWQPPNARPRTARRAARDQAQ